MGHYSGRTTVAEVPYMESFICKRKSYVDAGRVWDKICRFFAWNSSRHNSWTIHSNWMQFSPNEAHIFFQTENVFSIDSMHTNPTLYSAVSTLGTKCPCVQGVSNLLWSSLLSKHIWYHSVTNRPNNSKSTFRCLSQAHSEQHKGFISQKTLITFTRNSTMNNDFDTTTTTVSLL